MQKSKIVEVQICEFLMILTSCSIISFSGGDGGIEIAEILALIVVPDGSEKSAFVLRKPDAFISAAVPSHSRILSILRDGSRAEIGPSIVQAIAIDMVNDKAIAGMAMAVMSSYPSTGLRTSTSLRPA